MNPYENFLWAQEDFDKLAPYPKLVLLYLLTSPLTDENGAAEISTRRIAFNTGMATNDVEDCIAELSGAGLLEIDTVGTFKLPCIGLVPAFDRKEKD